MSLKVLEKQYAVRHRYRCVQRTSDSVCFGGVSTLRGRYRRMKLKNCGYIYEPVKMDKRKEILPERNICSIAPAKEWEDAFFTRNGVQKINLLGDPENEIIVFKHELLYEPMWRKTPEPPLLAPLMPRIRSYLRKGETDKAVQIVEQAQSDAGYDPFLSRTDLGAVIPMSMLRLHHAFHFAIRQKSIGRIKNYLRWIDLMSGVITVQWEDDCSKYKREIFTSYKKI